MRFAPIHLSHFGYFSVPFLNPGSEVFDPQTNKDALQVFWRLRPNGSVASDPAYIEMIPYEEAAAVMASYRDTDIHGRTIYVVSMSKLFGKPRRLLWKKSM